MMRYVLETMATPTAKWRLAAQRQTWDGIVRATADYLRAGAHIRVTENATDDVTELVAARAVALNLAHDTE